MIVTVRRDQFRRQSQMAEVVRAHIIPKRDDAKPILQATVFQHAEDAILAQVGSMSTLITPVSCAVQT